MKVCPHSQWLHISVQNEDITLSQVNRLQRLLDELVNLDIKFYSLVVLIGNQSKSRTLCELVSITQHRKRSNDGAIHLYIEASSAFQDRPLLFVDGDISTYDNRATKIREDRCQQVIIRIFCDA